MSRELKSPKDKGAGPGCEGDNNSGGGVQSGKMRVKAVRAFRVKGETVWKWAQGVRRAPTLPPGSGYRGCVKTSSYAVEPLGEAQGPKDQRGKEERLGVGSDGRWEGIVAEFPAQGKRETGSVWEALRGSEVGDKGDLG